MVYACLHTSTLHRSENDLEKSEKAVDLVLDIICAFFFWDATVNSAPFPTSLNTTDPNAECPTSMRVGNITPAAEIPCQIPTIWTPWRPRYFFQLTSWDVSKPLVQQLCLTIYSRDTRQTYHLLFHHMFNHECAVFQLIVFTRPTCPLVDQFQLSLGKWIVN